MQRINSTRIAAQASPFDPLAISRQADVGQRILQPVAQGLDAVAAKQRDIDDRNDEMQARIAFDRAERETAAALETVRTTMAETGSGYAREAMAAAEQVRADILAQYGDSPGVQRRLSERFDLDREELRGTFEQGERDFTREYALGEHLRTVDDARQAVSRVDYGVGGVAPTDFAAFRDGLVRTESGGRSGVVNSEGFVGLFQFGEARLNDYRRATGADFDMEEFRTNPALQERVFEWHVRDIDEFITDNDLDRFIGQQINGVTVTQNGMRAVAHLGGTGGLRRMLTSGGSYNPADSNGTSLTDYLRTHGSAPSGIPSYAGPPPDVMSNPIVQAEIARAHDQIDAMPGLTRAQVSELKRAAEGQILHSALVALGEQNPSAGIAALESGQHDDLLSYEDDQRMQGGLRTILEQQMIDRAKERQEQYQQQARQTAEDNIAWQLGGRQGEAPPSMSGDQYHALTAAQQRSHDEAVFVGEAVAGARTVELSQAGAFLADIAPAGEGFALEQRAHEAAAEVIRERAAQEAVASHIDHSVVSGVSPDVSQAPVKNELSRRFGEAVSSSENPFAAAVEFVGDHRYAPADFGTMVGRALSSDDVATQVAAIEAVGQLQAADPRILRDAPNSTAIDRAIAANEYMHLGIPAAEAIQITRDMLDPAKQGQRSARLDQWRADSGQMEEDAWAALQDRIVQRGRDNGMSGGEARGAIPATVWGEYSDLVRDQFGIHGNMQVAVAVAERAFFASHAVTNIGGVPVWQRGAPEAHYRLWGDERDSAWIETQARDFADDSLGLSVEGVTLAPVGDARRDSAPEYQVFAQTDQGVVLVDGTFRPNINAEREVFEAEQQAQQSEADRFAPLAAADLVYRDARAREMDLIRDLDSLDFSDPVARQEYADAVEAAQAATDEAWQARRAARIEARDLDPDLIEREGMGVGFNRRFEGIDPNTGFPFGAVANGGN